jgi:hypothetical protein
MTAPDTASPLDLGQSVAQDQPLAVRAEAPLPVIQEGPGNLLSALVDMARDPSVKPETVAAFIAMQERLEDRQAEREFNQAMFRVQARLKPMIKRGTVDLGSGKGSYKFLRREDLDLELRPILEAEGFAISFTQKAAPSGGMIVYATARHVAGHYTTSEMELPPDTGPGRSSLQARVSTISFCERVLTEMIFNVVRKGADDDGVAGGKKFITEAEAVELVALAAAVGQQEGSFLDQLFAGAVRSFDEIEAGPGYLACRSTLEAMKRRNEKRAATKGDA